MKLILTEDVPSLGAIGDIVKVKNGYARNYLLPRTLAVVANESNQKELEHKQRVLKVKREKVLKEFQSLANKMNKVQVNVDKQVGEDDKIFGSVTTAEVAQELAKQNFEVDKRSISFGEEVKKTGEYKVQIKLHSEVVAAIKLVVGAK